MNKYKIDDVIIAPGTKNVYKVSGIQGKAYWLELIKIESGLWTSLEVGNYLYKNTREVDRAWKLLDASVLDTKYNPTLATLPPQIEMPHNIVTLQDAIRFEIEKSKPKYLDQAAVWHKEGKCPQCGELGRYHLSTAICSIHGQY